jgi:peptidoglycan/LPS O-acetylase OafA/YrhL
MLVVLDHAGVAVASGGFVGVDVFFVISGFLITGLIAQQRRAGRFSFSGFYWRRAKRLLPALFALLLAVLGAGYWLLIPSDYSLLAESALSAAGFVSNVFFWRNTGGYFSPDAASFPLLHVWSLSLEEQFYFVWPAALLLLLKLRSRRMQLAVVLAAAALSLVCAEYGVRAGGTWAYFLLPSRAGEFLLGAFTYLAWRPRRSSPLFANACSATGLFVVLASAVMLGAEWPFPGLNAIWPCLGAALIIAAPQFGPSAATRLLSTRPFVFVGLISYSVYLWHWPIVSFLRISRVPITPAITLAVIAASLVLGAVSWFALERGFRGVLDRLKGFSVAWAAAGAFVIALAPVYVYAREGLPQRFPFALLTQDQLVAERARYWIDLPATNANLSATAPRQLLIVGDSHSYDLAYALSENGYPGKIKLIDTTWRCFNFGHQAVFPANEALCAERLQAVLDSPALKVADAVYLHDHWGGYDEAGLSDMLNRLRAITKAPIYVFGPQMQFSDNFLTISKFAQSQHYATIQGINSIAQKFEKPRVAERDRTLKVFFALVA